MMQPDLAANSERGRDGTAPCPSCNTPTGRLFSVSLKGSERTLRYQCAGCGQEWPVTDYCPGPNDPAVPGPTPQ